MSVGLRIREVRKAYGLTQQAFARPTGFEAKYHCHL